MSNPGNWLIAYHAEQSAEKALKAYLVFNEVDFPPTHNITVLRELCTGFGPWAQSLEAADELTRFATSTRYPGIGLRPTLEDVTRMIGIADHVRNNVMQALRQMGVA